MLIRRLLPAMLLGSLLVVVTNGSAQACEEWTGGEVGDGIEFGTECPGDDIPSDSDGSSDVGVGPSCTFVGKHSQFCEGLAACWGNNPALATDAEGQIDAPKPSEDAHPAYKNCRNPDGSTYYEWYWAESDEGPTLAESALTAYSQLLIPPWTTSYSPPAQTFVNLPTWWWAGGLLSGELVSPPALGVVAVATPDRLEVDPGDGTGVVSCPFTVAASDACTTVYRRSAPQGYAARARVVYDVRFELNGGSIDLPGLPTSLTSSWNGVTVPVREIQSIVTGIG